MNTGTVSNSMINQMFKHIFVTISLVIGLISLSNSIKCKDYLPKNLNFPPNSSNDSYTDIKAYQDLITTVGDYKHGHAISDHLAIKGQCTQYQINTQKDKSTVFLNAYEMSIAFNQDTTECYLSDLDNKRNKAAQIHMKKTNFLAIDCKSNITSYYSSFHIEYRKAISNSSLGGEKANRMDFVNSQIVTVYTMFPTKIADIQQRGETPPSNLKDTLANFQAGAGAGAGAIEKTGQTDAKNEVNESAGAQL